MPGKGPYCGNVTHLFIVGTGIMDNNLSFAMLWLNPYHQRFLVTILLIEEGSRFVQSGQDFPPKQGVLVHLN